MTGEVREYVVRSRDWYSNGGERWDRSEGLSTTLS